MRYDRFSEAKGINHRFEKTVESLANEMALQSDLKILEIQIRAGIPFSEDTLKKEIFRIMKENRNIA